uniref:Uncharacterized protein n=1 Tax=Davidia involucrata TaxID=16924 RepID=A0A5B7C656_DAVIN
MANSICSTPLTFFNPPNKPGLIIIGNSTAGKVLWINDITQNCKNTKFQSLMAKATDSNQRTKPNSIVCSDCDGNGKWNDWSLVTSISPLSLGFLLCITCIFFSFFPF